MPIKAGVGRSNNKNSFEAGQEACREALEEVGGGSDLFIVFSSVAFDQEKMLEGVSSIAEDAMVVGCSDSGEIISEGELAYSENVVVMAYKLDGQSVFSAKGEGADKNSFKAGKETAKNLKKKGDPSLLIVLTDGLPENGADIVRGIQDVLGDDFPIMGGAAGDDFKFEKTFQYYGGEVLTGTVVGIGIKTDIAFGRGVKHGWKPIGVPMEVTKAEGAVLKEVDGKPALTIYEDYFGKKAEELIEEPIAKMAYTYPLGMSVEGKEEFLIRDVVVANKNKEITVAAEIPEGTEIRLMLGDRKRAVTAARQATENALEELDGEPKAALVFNCMARNKLLGRNKAEEIEAIQKVLGKDVPFIGFYTYGEIAPLKKGEDKSVWHNETMTLLVLG